MSRFLVLNFQDFGLNHHITETIQSETLLCLCCLENNAPLLDITHCEHSKYLDNFIRPQVKYSNLVCYNCHATLKKIECFRQQVEESFRILEDATLDKPEIINNKKLNFTITKAVDINLLHRIPQKYVPPAKPSILKRITRRKRKPTKDIVLVVDDDLVTLKSHSDALIDISAGINKLNQPKKQSIDVNACKNIDIADIIHPFNLDNELDNSDGTDNIELAKEFELDGKIGQDDKYDSDIDVPNLNNDEDNGMKKNDNLYDAITLIDTDLPKPKATKIKVIKLNKDELNQERVLMAQSEDYLKYPYRCESCLVGFEYEDNIEDHMKRKHSPKDNSATCEICQQILSPPGSLSEHKYRHFTRYQCEECDLKFADYKEAMSHYRHAHEPPDGRYKCRHCDYTTRSHRELVVHKLTHESFVCAECGLVAASRGSMRRHRITRHKKTLHTCQCATNFTPARSLSRHTRVKHAASEAAHCGPCGAHFTPHHGLQFPCDDCGQQFSAVSHLRMHARMRHARVPALKCTQCSKVFTLAIELKQHVEKLHSTPRIAFCQICGKAYKNKSHLLRHYKEDHSDRNIKIVPKKKDNIGKVKLCT